MTRSFLGSASLERQDLHSLFEDFRLERAMVQSQVDRMIKSGDDISQIREINNRIKRESSFSLINF